MASELLACPFCARVPVTCAPDQQHPLVSVGCFECGMVCETQWLPEAEAITVWNRRAQPQQVDEAMVNRAGVAFNKAYALSWDERSMRAAIEAALQVKP